MLFQLRNLKDSEKETVKLAPIWVALYIANLDGKIEISELEKVKEVIHIKTYSEKNDVHYLYKELDNSSVLDDLIAGELTKLPQSVEERSAMLESRLAGLNQVFPKLDPEYTKQLYKSLRDIAVSVANAAGGVMGMGKITPEESEAIHLPMIEKP